MILTFTLTVTQAPDERVPNEYGILPPREEDGKPMDPELARLMGLAVADVLGEVATFAESFASEQQGPQAPPMPNSKETSAERVRESGLEGGREGPREEEGQGASERKLSAYEL
jgi:hypothetical protein